MGNSIDGCFASIVHAYIDAIVSDCVLLAVNLTGVSVY
jgi:hypothetical protein